MLRASIETIFSSKTGISPLIFGDQLRIEGRQAVTRNFKLDLAALGKNRFSAIAVLAIATAVFLALVEMMIDLGVQGSFGKRLLQLVEPVANNVSGRGASWPSLSERPE